MSKRGIANTFSCVDEATLDEFCNTYFPGKRSLFRSPARGQTVLSPPPGFVGVYIKAFTVGSMRFPFPSFLLDVLRYYNCHLSLMHPLGCARIIAFEVVCRAYGGVPTVPLFRKLMNLCPAGDWVTVGNRPKVDCVLKGGLEIRDWKDEFVYMDRGLVPRGYECLVDVSNLRVRKRGSFSDVFPEDDCGDIYDVLCKEGFVVFPYPEGILFKAGVARRLAEGEEEFDDMSYLQFIRKGVKEVSEMPKAIPQAAIGASGEGVADNDEVASKPIDHEEKDVEVLTETRKNKIPPSGSIASRLKRAKIAAKDESKRSNVTRKSTRKSTVDPVGSSRAGPKVLEAEFKFRTSIPKKTVDEIAAMSPEQFIESFDEDTDLHSSMLTEMRYRYKEAVEAFREMHAKVEELKSKVPDQSELLAKMESSLQLQEDTLKSRNEEISRLTVELQTRTTENMKLSSEANADKILIDELTQEVQLFKNERSRLVAEYVPYVCRSLLRSPDVLRSIGEAITAHRQEERSKVLEECSADGMLDLSTRLDYQPNAAEKVMQSAQEWEQANFPCISVFSSKPEALVDELLQLKL